MTTGARVSQQQKSDILPTRARKHTQSLLHAHKLPELSNNVEQGVITNASSNLNYHLGQVNIHQSSPTRIQPKLYVGAHNDRYEQEADHVAERVMRMPEPKAERDDSEEEIQEKPIQTKLRPNITLQREVEEGNSDEEEPLQTKRNNNSAIKLSSADSNKIQGLKGKGQPLSDTERNFFEPRFGYDFRDVRIHTDSQAANTANIIQAKAYTLGKDIVFNHGYYQPGSDKGRRLLAHELTHVVQQCNSLGVLRRTPHTLNDTSEIDRIKKDIIKTVDVSDRFMTTLLSALGDKKNSKPVLKSILFFLNKLKRIRNIYGVKTFMKYTLQLEKFWLWVGRIGQIAAVTNIFLNVAGIIENIAQYQIVRGNFKAYPKNIIETVPCM